MPMRIEDWCPTCQAKERPPLTRGQRLRLALKVSAGVAYAAGVFVLLETHPLVVVAWLALTAVVWTALWVLAGTKGGAP